MIFFSEKIPSIFDIENWRWKYDFGTFGWTIIHRRIVFRINSFEHVDSWAKILHFRTNHLYNSTTELTLGYIQGHHTQIDAFQTNNFFMTEWHSKGAFFRKWESFFKSPNLPKKLFQKTSLNFEKIVYWYGREFQISSSG